MATIVVVCLGLIPSASYGQSGTLLLTEGRDLFRAGQFEDCLRASLAAIDDGDQVLTWWELALRCQLELGRYAEADQLLDRALERHSESIVLRWIGRDVRRMHNRPGDANRFEDEIEMLLRQSPWRYRDIPSQLVMADLLLLRGADPKLVLDRLLKPLREENDDVVAIHLTIGRLALSKQDFALAAESFQQAARVDPKEPAAHLGVAQAFETSDDAQVQASLAAALQANARYVPALLLAVEKHVAAENYDEARQALGIIEQVNPHHPLMWAFRSVIAHLVNQPDEERIAYERALAPWKTNAEVDYVIGRELSRKYRFAEGAGFQRQALEKDPRYLAARLQLSQDLLRLGKEDEGWALAADVYRADPYQVLAYNLTELRDRLARYNTRYGDGLLLRMDPRESRIFGSHAHQLLLKARSELAAKYDVRLTQPVVVEMFPRQADFAIRTFGLPGGEGFLGVCFGNVITANSPSDRPEEATNWQSTLWHEFCHVVTLNKTNNKMPRWLSEGISVYEERQANGAWGQRMTPRTRQMVLGEDLVPVSKLSSAFLSPKSAEHLQFAYYESSLVVEWLVETQGRETLNRILDDLGIGLSIEEVLTRHVGASEYVDREFAEYARQQAEQYGAEADWTELPEEPMDIDALRDWLEDHPKNFFAMHRLAQLLVEDPSAGRPAIAPSRRGDDQQAATPAATLSAPMAERLGEAEALWLELRRICPEDAGAGCARARLAALYRQRGDIEREVEQLTEIAERNGEALDVRLRLLEIARQPRDGAPDGNPEAAQQWAAEILQINPFISAARESLARQYRKLDQPVELIQELESQLELSPLDPAALHYELAEVWRPLDRQAAKRHVVQALELAPRYRDALRMLLELSGEGASEPTEIPATPSAVPHENQPAPAPPDPEVESAIQRVEAESTVGVAAKSEVGGER